MNTVNSSYDTSPDAITKVSWHIPQMNSARWVMAKVLGFDLTVWLQNETVNGYWIQVDVDGPCHFISEIWEIEN